ncbi:MAG: hypothetical protein LBT01_09665 [Spirochaetaceae bacterium]|jgi:hypothetical protein|nr:hypothetical protein [Spirochaetaceae bacterium]
MLNDKIIIERIKRKIEPNMCITPQTTPVVFFGDYEKAKACVIALHPSENEFLDKNRNIIIGEDRRLYSRKELKKDDLCELEDDDIEKVLNCCIDYFKDISKPLSWFKDLESLINQFGYSYYDNKNNSNFNKCVQLDLVQWACPSWGSIKDKKIISHHLKNDLPVLKHLLKKKFEYIFLDSERAVSEVENLLGITLNRRQTKCINNKGTNENITIYIGEYNNAKVIGWSELFPSQRIGWFHLHQAINNVIVNNVVPGVK